ncbi:MAG TPA: GNAT family N-acetyltransferase [Kofleriaceae bacterium]|jgi:GNAT superfamily N-acetyltransferase|nr:GNAT family N-acetyltransferase [Kofleriaceae bacterium]
MSRFAIREAVLADADEIARVSAESWQSSYRGILPDALLERIDVGRRAVVRRRLLRDRSIFQLVAYDVTHLDIVGFCDAGASRREVPYAGEVYEIYLAHRAKRYGIGQEMFERVQAWLVRHGLRSMIVWVLEDNHHARRFYEAMGGRPAARFRSVVGGTPVIELSYVWDSL